LPLQLSNDLVHAASIINVPGAAVTGPAALPCIFPASARARLIAWTERSIADHTPGGSQGSLQAGRRGYRQWAAVSAITPKSGYDAALR
jgi:hypothetical protein